MLFKIQGIDAQGRKREVLVDAPSEDDALRRMAEDGIHVTAAVGLPDKAPAPVGEAYPAIALYATIGQIVGCLTILFAAIAAVAVGTSRDSNLVVAGGIFVAGLVAGIGQLAFAELLGLFVRLQTNTQYMCERLYALEQQSKSTRHAAPGTSVRGEGKGR